MGQVYRQQQRYDDALSSFQEALDICQRYFTSKQTVLPDSDEALRRSKEAEVKNNNKEEKEAYNLIFKHEEPDEANEELAHDGENSHGNTVGDEDDFSKLISVATVHNNMGLVYFGMGDFNKAEELFSLAAQSDPTNMTMQHNLAKCCLKLNKWNQCEAIYKMILDHLKEEESLRDEDEKVIELHKSLAKLYGVMGKKEESEHLWEKVQKDIEAKQKLDMLFKY